MLGLLVVAREVRSRGGSRLDGWIEQRPGDGWLDEEIDEGIEGCSEETSWLGEKGIWEDPDAEGECGGGVGWMGQEALVLGFCQK